MSVYIPHQLDYLSIDAADNCQRHNRKESTMSPVSTIRLEESLKARSRAAAAKKTTTTRLAKGQRRVTTPVKQKADAKKAAGHDAPHSNAAKKPARAAKKASPGPKRLTLAWTSAKGAEVKPKDRVRTSDGFVLSVLGRWSKKLKTGEVVPYVTGEIIKAPAGAVASVKGGSKNRAVAASDVTHAR
jgi:hypothetical protein